MIFQRWPSTCYLEQNKKHQSEKIPDNVCYILKLETHEFIFRLHWRPDQSNLKKKKLYSSFLHH